MTFSLNRLFNLLACYYKISKNLEQFIYVFFTID
nr:MAG TPA: hypothetical protein [Caudoviricetes sp.]